MGFSFLIFDLDGTLINSQIDIASAVNSVRWKYGFERLSVKRIRSYLGSGIDRLLDKAIPKKKGIDKSEVVELFEFYYGECLVNATVIYDGVVEMLEALKNKDKAILSNKTEKFSCEIVKRLKISNYFIKVWGGDSVIGARKPDPRPVVNLIKVTNSDISETVMIGDGANDFLAAKAAGIPSIAVSYGYSDVRLINRYNPDFIVKTPKDIIDIVF
ncbi:MAG: HAD-IA family hydrolase [Endomicrobium sp.]|jgi:phosphoglycolate phosphatase|nr:HAD-IA family hydrolase [Endomicrobium sp.]